MAQGEIELGTSVGYALKQAASALRAAMETDLRGLDLTVSQYSCLELLRQRPGLSASELARGTFVTRQSMQTLVEGLVARGLLERPERPERGRALPARLTPEGLAAVEEASRVVAGVEQRMLAGLDRDGRAALLAGLVACADALGG